MNKEKLIQLGLSEEQATASMKLSKEDIDQNYITKSRFNEIVEKSTQLKAELAERDETLESLQDVNMDGLEGQIAELEASNQELATDYETQINQLKIQHALDNQLKSAGVRNPKATLALLDLEVMELDEEGTIRGLDEQLQELKTNEGYLFEDEKQMNKKAILKGVRPGKKVEETDPVDLASMTYNELDAHLNSQ